MQLLRPLSILTLAVPLLAQQPVAVEATIKKAAPRGTPVQPVAEQIALQQAAPKSLTGKPACVDPWFGQKQIGSSTITVAVGKSSADAELPDVLFVDRNGNGTFDDGERLELTVTSQAGRGNAPATQRSQAVDCELQLGGKTIAAELLFARSGDAAPSLMLRFSDYLEADVVIDDRHHVVVVLDKDLDGTYGSAKDLWGLTKADAQPLGAYALLGIREHAYVDGHLVGIKVAGNTVQVTTKAADGPLPEDLAAQRVRVEHIWSDRFDAEREQFVAQRGLDTKRPLAKKPIEWHYVTFDEALALGRKAGKPVFVDVMAFWCVWCYRMDYYTYPDQEVAALLGEQFVPVKIIQEQDPAGDYDAVMKGKLEARGIPAMGIFDGDGNVLHKIGGWKKPEDFLADLKQGLEKFKAK